MILILYVMTFDSLVRLETHFMDASTVFPLKCGRVEQ